MINNNKLIPGISEPGHHIEMYYFGKPSPNKVLQRLLSCAERRTTGSVEAWNMRVAADTIEDLQLEIIKLGGT